MRAGNSCKKSLSLREFSVRVLWVFLLIGCLVTPAGAVDFWDITVVDSAGDVGDSSSVAILPSGNPAISYYDRTNNCLKYAWYDTSTWQTTIVDSLGGGSTSLAILPSGHPAISYYDSTNDDLKYAWYDGSAWQTSTVDSEGDVGGWGSLAVLPSGHPAISYCDWTNKDLKYAWYDGSTWQTTTVDSEGTVGLHTSLAILPSGHPAISYGDTTTWDEYKLKYAWYDGNSWHTEIVDSGGRYTSLAILPSGQPAISYKRETYMVPDFSLRYAWYDGSTWQTEFVDTSTAGGVSHGSTSLAITSSGEPAISYHGGGYEQGYRTDLKYACFDGSTWQTDIVDSEGSPRRYCSLAFFASGQPAISYYVYDDKELRFATPADIAPAPIATTVDYTATAHTDLGGTTSVVNGPAHSHGTAPGFSKEAFADSSVSLGSTSGGHLKAFVSLSGEYGVDCVGWDPETEECLMYVPISCEDANGTVSGTIVIGTSQAYPADSELDLGLDVIVQGDPGDAEDYHLQIWRGESSVAEVDPCAPQYITIPVFAGETLTFELFAWEEDYSYSEYNRTFEFRMILRGLANLDGKGTVDFRDFAIFASAFLSEPGDGNWNTVCDISLPADFYIDWRDFDVFTGHWLE